MNRMPIVTAIVLGLLMIVGAKTALFPGSVDKDTSQPKATNPKVINSDSKATHLKPPAADTLVKETRPASSAELPVNEPVPVANKGISSAKREEATSFCGAPTKKGTPCSRRVKTKGYCWQHKK